MLCFPTTRERECKAGLTILTGTEMIKLSNPGPQFLVFLEKYAWEIVTRWGMSSGESSPTTTPGVEDEDTLNENEELVTEDGAHVLDVIVEEDEGEEAEARNEEEERRKEEQRRQEEEVFGFMVGNYCVRRFLEDVERNLSRINNPELEDALAPIDRPGKFKQHFQGLKIDWKKCIRKRKEKKAQKGNGGGPRMMFGEIPSDEHMPTMAEKASKRPVEAWMKGLVWYYGVSTKVPVSSGVEEALENRLKSCVGVIKSGLSKAGMRVRQVWRRRYDRGERRRVVVEEEEGGMGEFQSLDD